MSKNYQARRNAFIKRINKKNPGEPEFLQAVQEVAHHIYPYIADKPIYNEKRIMERLAEPDRVVMFRVCWEDDKCRTRVNRGYRVQNNNAIGPFKGGLRFHPSVNLSILKFLAFEQTFKNSLTGLPMGGAKGGSDFDPKGKSDAEVMRFCQAFMTELFTHIGPDTDIPAGDIGVGAREIGYLFGQYKRLTRKFTGVLTGKGLQYGGSPIRVEATGYGTVYFLADMLRQANDDLDGKTVVISGAGNVAQHACEKAIQLGARVVTFSDSSGFVYDKEGITPDKLEFVKELKNGKRGRISEYAKEFKAEYYEGKEPWIVECDVALPCATQNEINKKDAQTLLKNGCKAIAEGANMPSDLDALKIFQNAKILFAPSKAANAGGVAISGLEMSQNSARVTWTKKKLEKRLRKIMANVHNTCIEHGRESKTHVNYLKGANIGGFIKVADAMLAYGVV